LLVVAGASILFATREEPGPQRDRGSSVGFKPERLTAFCRRLRRDEGGQVLVLTAVGMIGICGMAGFAIDVGAFYQAHRKQQAIADAAALAAAGDLPKSTSQATSDANAYATKNGGTLSSISYSTTYMTNDTVTVRASKTVPTTFLGAVGINSANVSVSTTVRAENLQTAIGAAPFGVINTQPELGGDNCPCFGVSTTLDETKGPGPGGFGLINIDGSRGGTSPDTLASWITSGCNCSQTVPVDLYSDTGAKFNSSQVQAAMDGAVGRTLLFPVYDSTSGEGANLTYHVIGWTGFHISAWTAKGTDAIITGYFDHVDWEGSGSSQTSNYFGATTSRMIG
jgi:Flp pilus assembly protein TadG